MAQKTLCALVSSFFMPRPLYLIISLTVILETKECLGIGLNSDRRPLALLNPNVQNTWRPRVPPLYELTTQYQKIADSPSKTFQFQFYDFYNDVLEAAKKVGFFQAAKQVRTGAEQVKSLKRKATSTPETRPSKKFRVFPVVDSFSPFRQQINGNSVARLPEEESSEVDNNQSLEIENAGSLTNVSSLTNAVAASDGNGTDPEDPRFVEIPNHPNPSHEIESNNAGSLTNVSSLTPAVAVSDEDPEEPSFARIPDHSLHDSAPVEESLESDHSSSGADNTDESCNGHDSSTASSTSALCNVNDRMAQEGQENAPTKTSEVVSDLTSIEERQADQSSSPAPVEQVLESDHPSSGDDVVDHSDTSDDEDRISSDIRVDVDSPVTEPSSTVSRSILRDSVITSDDEDRTSSTCSESGADSDSSGDESSTLSNQSHADIRSSAPGPFDRRPSDEGPSTSNDNDEEKMENSPVVASPVNAQTVQSSDASTAARSNLTDSAIPSDNEDRTSSPSENRVDLDSPSNSPSSVSDVRPTESSVNECSAPTIQSHADSNGSASGNNCDNSADISVAAQCRISGNGDADECNENPAVNGSNSIAGISSISPFSAPSAMSSNNSSSVENDIEDQAKSATETDLPPVGEARTSSAALGDINSGSRVIPENDSGKIDSVSLVAPNNAVDDSPRFTPIADENLSRESVASCNEDDEQSATETVLPPVGEPRTSSAASGVAAPRIRSDDESLSPATPIIPNHVNSDVHDSPESTLIAAESLAGNFEQSCHEVDQQLAAGSNLRHSLMVANDEVRTSSASSGDRNLAQDMEIETILPTNQNEADLTYCIPGNFRGSNFQRSFSAAPSECSSMDTDSSDSPINFQAQGYGTDM